MTRGWKPVRRAIAVTAAVLLWSAAFAADPAIDPALNELNTVSRQAYAEGRKAFLSRSGVVIVVASDELLLLRNGREMRVNFTPPVYHTLKSVSHLPLGIYGVLAPAAAGVPAATDWRAALVAMREKAGAVRAGLERMGLTEKQRHRQERLIDAGIGFIDETLRSGVVSAAALRAFAQRVAALTLANSADAARAQVDGLHAAFTSFKNDLEPHELDNLYVLVLGPRTPRAGNLQYEYFVHALGPQSADRRVIYAESIFDEERALGLLSTLLIDREIGRDFYDEEGRMERDLLADGAKARLLEIFGRLGRD